MLAKLASDCENGKYPLQIVPEIAKRVAHLDVYQRTFGARECPLHDPLAAGISVDPSYITEALRLAIDVSLAGANRGQTVVDRRSWMAPATNEAERRERVGGDVGAPKGASAAPALVTIPMRVDGPRFVRDLIETLKVGG